MNIKFYPLRLIIPMAIIGTISTAFHSTNLALLFMFIMAGISSRMFPFLIVSEE